MAGSGQCAAPPPGRSPKPVVYVGYVASYLPHPPSISLSNSADDPLCRHGAAWCRRFVLTQLAVSAQNVGMSIDGADKSGSRTRIADPAERLRAGRLGAFFRPSQVADAGITRDELRALVRRGTVEHACRGLYRMADAEPTENYSLATACARIPNGIICLLSALRVYDIGSQAPAEVWIAIPHKARRPRLPGLRLRVVRFSGPARSLGVKETAFEGVPARITTPARTVADCFRFERLVGPEVAMEALQDGLRQRKVTVAELSSVEETLRSRRLSAALDSRSM